MWSKAGESKVESTVRFTRWWWKNCIVQRPESDSSISKLLLPIDKCGSIDERKTSKKDFFMWPSRILLPKKYMFTFVSGVPILNNSWVWYSHNIQPMIYQLSNRNITQRRTQASRPGCHDQQVLPGLPTWGPNQHPVDVGCSFFRYTNEDPTNLTNQRHKQRKWSRERTNLHLGVILGATLHKEDIGKE